MEGLELVAEDRQLPLHRVRAVLEAVDEALRNFAHGHRATMDEKTRSHKDAVLAYALEMSGADPAASFMVGDREYDVLGGRKFGMTTVGVLYGFGDRAELEQAGAHYICDTITELLEVLLK